MYAHVGDGSENIVKNVEKQKKRERKKKKRRDQRYRVLRVAAKQLDRIRRRRHDADLSRDVALVTSNSGQDQRLVRRRKDRVAIGKKTTQSKGLGKVCYVVHVKKCRQEVQRESKGWAASKFWWRLTLLQSTSRPPTKIAPRLHATVRDQAPRKHFQPCKPPVPTLLSFTPCTYLTPYLTYSGIFSRFSYSPSFPFDICLAKRFGISYQ